MKSYISLYLYRLSALLRDICDYSLLMFRASQAEVQITALPFAQLCCVRPVSSCLTVSM